MADFTSDPPSESTVDPELLEANARILKLRQARQEFRSLNQANSTDYTYCTENTESTDRIQKIQNDSEGFQKDPEGVDFVDRTLTLKAEVQKLKNAYSTPTYP